MSQVVDIVLDRKNSIAALVRFERKAIDDPLRTRLEGRYVAQDVDFAIITPPYSKDELWKQAKTFILDNEDKVRQGKMDPAVSDRYKRQYEAWKAGQELPLDGTPIKGWPVLSPAQQEVCIRANIPTVEYLSQINDEGQKAIGMGALDMKRKAIAWLQQATDKGPLTLEIAGLKQENDLLKKNLDSLTVQMQTILAQLPTDGAARSQITPSTGIALTDILDEPEPAKRGPGRPRKED